MAIDAEALNESADRAADFLRAVAHPGRLRIICALLDGERSASQLALQAQLSGPALSQHAAVLEAEGLITRRRKARSMLYRLAAPEAKSLAELLYRLFCKPPRAPTPRRGVKRGDA
jgi:DNA-binding transcriptional ArsR family regulator